MGIRVSFSLGAPDGIVGLITKDRIRAALDWYYCVLEWVSIVETLEQQANQELSQLLQQLKAGGWESVANNHLVRFDQITSCHDQALAPPGALAAMRRFVLQDGSLLTPKTSQEAWDTDRALDFFFGHYCDLAPDQSILAGVGPDLYLRHFEDAMIWLEKVAPQAQQLWRFLLEGRGVGMGNIFPYTSKDGVYRLSFWTREECTFLEAQLHCAHKTSQAEPRTDTSSGLALSAALDAIAAARSASTGMVIEVA